MGVTLFFLEKNLTIFLVIAAETGGLFAVVYSPLPSSHVVYSVFFLNSATKINLRSGVTPWRVSSGAVRQWVQVHLQGVKTIWGAEYMGVGFKCTPEGESAPPGTRRITFYWTQEVPACNLGSIS